MADWAAPLQKQLDRMKRTEPLLNRIADEIILPTLKSNFLSSGIKSHTGMLYRGITERGARGNYVRTTGSRVVVGVSYQAIPYARWVLEGRGPVVAKRAKALRFVINGRIIFRKRVGPAPAHRVYYLSEQDAAKVRALVGQYLKGK